MNKRLTPKLRFPEFRDEWEELSLGEVGEIVTGKTPSTADSALWNGEIQFVTPTDIKDEKYQYKTQRTVSLTEKIKVLPKHSIMFTCIASIGKMAISVFPCITNQQINTLIPKDDFDNEYVYYALLSITDYIKSTQASSTLPIINKTEFSKFLLPVSSPAEQQKIAECLTALDDLIAAQGEKVEALKAYKKGLMQNLFPAEGESTPRLRFPEFQSAGEWEVRTIGQISENITAGGTPSTSKKEYWNGNIRWMNSGELNYKRVYEVQGRITEKGLQNSSTKIIPSHCVLIGLAGQGKTRGTVAMNMIELCTNQSIAAIFPNEQVYCSDFLYHNLDNRYDELRRISAGGEGRGGLNLQIIKSLKIILPSLPEQQRIAEALSALDEEIRAEGEALAALKVHKRGLMQGLFPSP